MPNILSSLEHTLISECYSIEVVTDTHQHPEKQEEKWNEELFLNFCSNTAPSKIY